MFKSSEDSVVESSLLCYISSGDYMKKLMFDCDDTLYDLSWPFRKCMEEFLPNADVDMDLFYADYRKFGDMIFDDERQKTDSGGSGCGCSAVVTCGYLYKKLMRREIKSLLFLVIRN